MIQGLLNRVQHPATDQMSFEERLGLLVDREMTNRLDRCLKNRLLQAKLKQKAFREGYTAVYQRLPGLFQELPLAKGDGSYSELLNRLVKTDVLLLDDWGLAKLSAEQRRDLLEILEDRHGSRSTIVTSQPPLDQWHASIVGTQHWPMPLWIAWYITRIK
jgi:hypothetical protein